MSMAGRLSSILLPCAGGQNRIRRSSAALATPPPARGRAKPPSTRRTALPTASSRAREGKASRYSIARGIPAPSCTREGRPPSTLAAMSFEALLPLAGGQNPRRRPVPLGRPPPPARGRAKPHSRSSPRRFGPSSRAAGGQNRPLWCRPLAAFPPFARVRSKPVVHPMPAGWLASSRTREGKTRAAAFRPDVLTLLQRAGGQNPVSREYRSLDDPPPAREGKTGSWYRCAFSGSLLPYTGGQNRRHARTHGRRVPPPARGRAKPGPRRRACPGPASSRAWEGRTFIVTRDEARPDLLPRAGGQDVCGDLWSTGAGHPLASGRANHPVGNAS